MSILPQLYKMACGYLSMPTSSMSSKGASSEAKPNLGIDYTQVHLGQKYALGLGYRFLRKLTFYRLTP